MEKTNLYIYIYIYIYILHFHLDDNAPCLSPKLCIAIDSNYSLALQWSQKKNLEAEIKCIIIYIYVKMVNFNTSLL